MPLNETDDKTHEILSEELEEYDREDVETEVEEALANSPDPTPESNDSAQFELYEDAAGEWGWRLVSEEGEVLAVSPQSYEDEKAAQRSIEKIRQTIDSTSVTSA